MSTIVSEDKRSTLQDIGRPKVILLRPSLPYLPTRLRLKSISLHFLAAWRSKGNASPGHRLNVERLSLENQSGTVGHAVATP